MMSPTKRSHYDDDGPQEAVKPIVKKESNGTVNEENENGIKESSKENAVPMSGRPSKRSRHMHSDRPQEAVKPNNKSADEFGGAIGKLKNGFDVQRKELNKTANKGIKAMREHLAAAKKDRDYIVATNTEAVEAYEKKKATAEDDLVAANNTINHFKGDDPNTDLTKIVEDGKAEAKKAVLKAAIPSKFNLQPLVDLLKAHDNFTRDLMIDINEPHTAYSSLSAVNKIFDANSEYHKATKDLPLNDLKASIGAMIDAHKMYKGVESGIEELNAALGKKEAAEATIRQLTDFIAENNAAIENVLNQVVELEKTCNSAIKEFQKELDSTIDDHDEEQDFEGGDGEQLLSQAA